MPIASLYNTRQFFLPIVLLSCFGSALAQTSFKATADQSEIAKDGVLNVEFIITYTSAVDQFTPPAFSQFNLLGGPVQQTGMSYVNGVISRYQSFSYSLQPKVTGRITLGPGSAIVDKKPMRSNLLSVLVGNYSSGNSVSPGGPVRPFQVQPEVDEQYDLKRGENAQQKIKDNLVVRLLTNKTSCYEGEPLIATYELCSRLKSASRVTKRPSLNGFSVYDMVEPETNNPEVKKVNGKYFNVHLIRKAQLYPLQPGTFTLEPVELENKIRLLKRDGSATPNDPNANPLQDMLDEFMPGQSGEWQELTVTMMSKPVDITVKPLPEGKPEGFNGAVGNFTIAAKIDSGKVIDDKAISLQVEIKGEGNLPLINAPVVDFPKGFEGGDPDIKEQTDKSVAPIHGSKFFTYSIIPSDTGELVIPPIRFAYFNPGSSSYKTVTTDSIRVHVLPGRKKKNSFGRTVKVDPEKNNFLNLVWLLPLAVILTAAIVGWSRKRKRGPLEDWEATPVAIVEPVTIVDPLAQARTALEFDDNRSFYTALQEALWSECGEMLHLKGSELNKQTVFAGLRNSGMASATIEDLRAVFHECEMALYTPVYSAIDRQKAFDRATQILDNIREIKV